MERCRQKTQATSHDGIADTLIYIHILECLGRGGRTTQLEITMNSKCLMFLQCSPKASDDRRCGTTGNECGQNHQQPLRVLTSHNGTGQRQLRTVSSRPTVTNLVHLATRHGNGSFLFFFFFLACVHFTGDNFNLTFGLYFTYLSEQRHKENPRTPLTMKSPPSDAMLMLADTCVTFYLTFVYTGWLPGSIFRVVNIIFLLRYSPP